MRNLLFLSGGGCVRWRRAPLDSSGAVVVSVAWPAGRRIVGRLLLAVVLVVIVVVVVVVSAVSRAESSNESIDSFNSVCASAPSRVGSIVCSSAARLPARSPARSLDHSTIWRRLEPDIPEPPAHC
jgi:hypothetical protein